MSNAGNWPAAPTAPFANRAEAGRALAARLREYSGRPDVLVLALPRGGVPVAYEVARALHAPLDVFLVRKIGVPGHEELALGAIATGGVVVWNQTLLRDLNLDPDLIDEAVARERRELERRQRLYRGNRPEPEVEGKTAILVDDGLATGATMRAAAEALKLERPSRIVVAVPVAAADTCAEFRDYVDEIVCVQTPAPFVAVGFWYRDFDQTTDEEVRELLERAAAETGDRLGVPGR